MKPFCNSVHNLPLSVGLAKCPQQHCVQEQTKGGMSHSDGKNHQWTSCSCCVHHWSLFEAGCWSMQTSGFAQPAAIYSYLGFCYSEQLFKSAVRLKCQQGYERGEKTEVYGDHAAGTGSVCLPDGASLFGRRTVPLHCSTPLPSCISCSHVGINPFAED